MKTWAQLEAEIVASYVFTAADAARSMGNPVHPSLHDRMICFIVSRNGHVIVGDGEDDQDAYARALSKFQDLDSALARNISSLSAGLRAQITAELAGVPFGRTDIDPKNVPALSGAPENFSIARAITFEDVDADGLPLDPVAAWDKLRAEVAGCDPAFPTAFLGYHYSRPEGENYGILTLYA